MKSLLAVFVFINIAISSYANCYTGFACSISSLGENQKEQYKEFSNELNKYFSKKINENAFFSKKVDKLAYKDLFLFNTII